MNLQTAIEISTFVRQTGQYVCDTDDETALNLTIEAAKHFQINRKHTTIECVTLLPGETKD